MRREAAAAVGAIVAMLGRANRAPAQTLCAVPVVFAGAAGAQPGVPPAPAAVVASRPTAPDVQALPRLRGLADVAVQARVNAILAREDRRARADRRACLADARAADRRRGDPAVGGDYQRSVTVAYRSVRFVSVETVTEFYCGGLHPDDDTDAITLDLAAGRVVNWALALRPGVLPAADADVAIDGSVVGRRYLAGYRGLQRRADPAHECEAELRTASPFRYTFWLARDARGRPGLAVQPNVAHVFAACVDPVVLRGAETRDLVVDAALRAELASGHATRGGR